MGPARAGQLAHVRADECTAHVLIGDQLVKTVPSSLDAEDLATLKMRGASPAGPPPAAPAPAPAPARAGSLPSGTVIVVDRAADANGVADLAGHRLKAGAELAPALSPCGSTATWSMSSATASWPGPCPVPFLPLTGPGCAAPGSPRPRCRRPLVTEHRVWHLERLRHGDSASLGTKVGTSWARWLAAESI